MIAVLVMILGLLGIVIWLLLAPMVIYVDTQEKIYYAGIPGIKVVLTFEGWERLKVKVELPFFSFYIKKRKGKPKSKYRDQAKKKKGVSTRRPPLTTLVHLAWRMMRTFRVRALRLTMDTDDYVLNAQLVPIFFGLSRGNVQLNTNFQREWGLHLELENRLARLLKALWPFFIKHKFHR